MNKWSIPWSAPRRPNHQSKVFNLKRFTHVSSNAMRESKKRFWRLKNHSKSSSEGLKIHPESNSKAIVLQRTPSNIIFSNICEFLMIFGFQNALKSREKTFQIRCFKTPHFWIRILNGFSTFWLLKTKAKSRFFCYFFQKRRFYENRAPVEAKLLFFTFWASEKRLKIDANIDLEKNIEKNPQKSIFPSKLASQNLPKSIHQSIYLSLDLSLVALIIKARSSTWNAPHMSLQMRCGTQEQNLPKIHPKLSQNAPKILPKPSLNPPRTLPEPPFKTEREKKSIFSDFVQFLESLGLPQIDPKSRKIQIKNWKNRN